MIYDLYICTCFNLTSYLHDPHINQTFNYLIGHNTSTCSLEQLTPSSPQSKICLSTRSPAGLYLRCSRVSSAPLPDYRRNRPCLSPTCLPHPIPRRSPQPQPSVGENKGCHCTSSSPPARPFGVPDPPPVPTPPPATPAPLPPSWYLCLADAPPRVLDPRPPQ